MNKRIALKTLLSNDSNVFLYTQLYRDKYHKYTNFHRIQYLRHENWGVVHD